MTPAHRLLCAWAVIAAGGPRDDTQLSVLWRQIDPPRVLVRILTANGDLSCLEILPGSNEIADVRRGRFPGALALLDTLSSAAFFDWPDSVFSPPRGLDVESGPVRVELRMPPRSRVLTTREPYVPSALVAVLDSLEAANRRAVPVDHCVVCMPRWAREAVPQAVDATASPPGSDLDRLARATSGPFPVVFDAGGGELVRHHGRSFAIQTARGTYRVECMRWDR